MADQNVGLSTVTTTAVSGGASTTPGPNGNTLGLLNDIFVDPTDLSLDAQLITIVAGETSSEAGFSDVLVTTGDPVAPERTLTADAFDTLVLDLGPGDLDNTRAPGRPVGDFVSVEGDLSVTRLSKIFINGSATSVNGADGVDLSLMEGDYTGLVSGGLEVSVSLGAGDDEFVAALESVTGIAGVFQSYDGGAGFDEIDLSFASFDLFVDLTGPVDADGYVVINSEDVGLSNSLRVKNVEAILGGAGNDIFIGGAGQQAFAGGAGNDEFFGGAGPDEMDGDDGDDLFHGDAGADAYVGGDGIDTVTYQTSLAAVTVDLAAIDNRGRPIAQSGGDATGDTLVGIENVIGSDLATRSDRLSGDAGSNVLSGLAGNDTLNGRGGADFLDGGAGNDSMTGGTGNDTFVIDAIGDRAIENAGQGNDTVLSGNINLSLANYANVENATLTGALNLTLQGSAGANRLTGNDGANLMAGGAGADVLIGGLGADTMDGGTGNDIFRYLSELDTGVGAGARDIIRGFVIGQDRIDLSAIDANTDFFSPDIDPFDFIGNAAFSGSAGELMYYQQGTGASAITVVAGDITGDGVADFEIQLNGTFALSATDFLFG